MFVVLPAGIVNVMKDVQQQTGKPPYAVFGGTSPPYCADYSAFNAGCRTQETDAVQPVFELWAAMQIQPSQCDSQALAQGYLLNG